jgi:hypothetical protein
MAQTARWLSVGEAAARLHRTDREVLALVFAGALDSELRLDHYEVSAVSVEEYAARLDIAAPGSELAAREGEDLAETASARKSPVWTPWSSADDPEARAEQADYDDTPNEEGDENQ